MPGCVARWIVWVKGILREPRFDHDDFEMRVIAGEFKGRKLTLPKDDRVRPTTDRVKEAIFSMIADNLPDAVCLDLFAGSGSLGIEAISRGAERVYFCDASPEAMELVQKNVKTVGADAHAVFLRCDWRQAIGRLSDGCAKWDIVLIDAPYDLCDDYPKILLELKDANVLSDEAVVVIERDAAADGYANDVASGFARYREKRYGGTGVDIWIFSDAD
jgi:16S rRNA (guanine(966)-N(2))-methyltransferase RsmD